MTISSNNEQPSHANRGEMAQNIKEDFSKSLEHPSKTRDAQALYIAENSGLESILNEATATKTDIAEQSSETKPEETMISAEEAAGLAVGALGEFCKCVSEMTGKDLTFGGKFVTVFAMAATPIIQKYSRHVNLDPEKINLDSWVPECLAVGAVAAVGGTTWWQLKKQPNNVPEDKSSGDKS